MSKSTIDRTVLPIRCDNGLVVDRSHAEKAPFRFTGDIKPVVFDIAPGRALLGRKLRVESKRELRDLEGTGVTPDTHAPEPT